MGKIIQLSIHTTDDLGITAITFEYNDTGLPSNAQTLINVASAIIKSVKANKDSIMVDELLDELNIKKPG